MIKKRIKYISLVIVTYRASGALAMLRDFNVITKLAIAFGTRRPNGRRVIYIAVVGKFKICKRILLKFKVRVQCLQPLSVHILLSYLDQLRMHREKVPWLIKMTSKVRVKEQVE